MKSQFTILRDETNNELSKPLTADESIMASKEAIEEISKATVLDAQIETKKIEMNKIYDSCFDSKDWSKYDLLDNDLEILKAHRKSLLV